MKHCGCYISETEIWPQIFGAGAKYNRFLTSEIMPYVQHKYHFIKCRNSFFLALVIVNLLLKCISIGCTKRCTQSADWVMVKKSNSKKILHSQTQSMECQKILYSLQKVVHNNPWIEFNWIGLWNVWMSTQVFSMLSLQVFQKDKWPHSMTPWE